MATNGSQPTIDDIRGIIARLHDPAPAGCPWCLAQTPRTLAEDDDPDYLYEFGGKAAVDEDVCRRGRTILREAAAAPVLALLWIAVLVWLWTAQGYVAGIPLDALTWLAFGFAAMRPAPE